MAVRAPAIMGWESLQKVPFSPEGPEPYSSRDFANQARRKLVHSDQPVWRAGFLVRTCFDLVAQLAGVGSVEVCMQELAHMLPSRVRSVQNGKEVVPAVQSNQRILVEVRMAYAYLSGPLARRVSYCFVSGASSRIQ
jgi:hypothetical protein